MSDRENQGPVLVTGANRGIGLEFVRQYLHAGESVIAACRAPEKAGALAEMAASQPRLTLEPLDVGDEDSILALADRLETRGNVVATLIHNAGTVGEPEAGLHQVTTENARRVFAVNYLGPLLLTRALLPALCQTPAPRVAALTSRTGVLRPPPPPERTGGFAYACTKAALHRAIPILAGELRTQGIIVMGVDPGWVRTDMTSGASTATRYQLEPAESVRGMRRVIHAQTLEKTGCLWRFDGSLSRWYAPKETAEERQEYPQSSSA